MESEKIAILSIAFINIFSRTNGKSLFVGYSGNQNQGKKIKSGSVITVQHQGTNVYGTLQYPKFYRERTDLTWEELIKT